MSDAGAIGVTLHDLAETLSDEYYKSEGNVKSHIGFTLVFLKDLVNIIQKDTKVDLFLHHDLRDITFFANEEKEMQYIKKYLKEE